MPRGGGERPGVADGGESVVLGPSAHDGAGLAGGAGDWCGAGGGLQRTVVGLAFAVVTDLGEHDRAADVGQAGPTSTLDNRLVVLKYHSRVRRSDE